MSFQFTGKFEILKIDNRSFTKEMQERAKRLMREAAIAFLDAATSRIPKRTSFARGTFDNLADALGVKGKEGPRNTVPRKGGEYYYLSAKRRVRKSREAGRRYSSTNNIEKIIQTNFPTNAAGRVAAFVTKRTPTLTFRYNVSVRYLSVNEDKWKALQAGLNAFRIVILTKALRTIPKLTDFTTKKTVLVTPT